MKHRHGHFSFFHHPKSLKTIIACVAFGILVLLSLYVISQQTAVPFMTFVP